MRHTLSYRRAGGKAHVFAGPFGIMLVMQAAASFSNVQLSMIFARKALPR